MAFRSASTPTPTDGPRFEQVATLADVEFSEVSPAEFDAHVADALDSVPEELAKLVRNVVVLVEDEAAEDPHLLGLYEGWALTERPANHAGALPDRIFLYRRPLVEMCEDRDHLVEEIGITVVHEVAHHFGIDDRRLHELGYA